MFFRKIIHIDMDAFYASVEEREDPSLVGRPLAVGYDGPRGVVSTANYVARRFGVHSAMAIARAKQLCPQLIIVPCHFPLYKEISQQVREIFLQYTDAVEPLSLDEAFLDVTHNKRGVELARDIAMEIKRQIWERTRLTASAGVSYNKLLAKIASDYRKPNGLTVVHPKRALDFIASLPVEDLWGVGPKTAEKMHQLGIFTGAQLRAQPMGSLVQHFGKAGHVYFDFARGIDDRPVVSERIRKSNGCEETFLADIWLDEDVYAELGKIADELERRLLKSDFYGRTLTLKVKYFDFTNVSRSVTGKDYLRSREAIWNAATALLSHIDYGKDKAIRLLGLSVSNPESHSRLSIFPTLFDDCPEELGGVGDALSQ